MVVPPSLANAARPAIGALLRGGHRAEQRTLALFIEEGHYARHLAAMRRLYRKRYRQLRDVLNASLSSPTGRGVIVDPDGVFLGTVDAHAVVDSGRRSRI